MDAGRPDADDERRHFLDHVADATADDLPTNIRAMRALVKGFPARPLAPEDVETLLSSSMTVPAPIRANLVARQIDGDDVLRTLQVPLLVTQGRSDTVVLPAMARPHPRYLPSRHALLVRKASATPPTWSSPTASTTSWPP